MVDSIYGVVNTNEQIVYYDSDANEIQLDDNQHYLLYLIVPSEWVITYTLDLPKMPNEKLIKVAGFSLEDKLIHPIAAYHLSVVSNEPQHKVIATITHETLSKIKTLIASPCHLMQVTTVSLLLPLNKAILFDGQVHLNVNGCALGIKEKDLAFYVEKYAPEMVETKNPVLTMIEYSRYNKTNLLTGKYKPKKIKTQNTSKLHYVVPSVVGIVIFYLFISLVEIIYFKHQSTLLEKQVEIAYYHLFPQAKSVIAPEVRVKQLIASQGDNTKASQFLTIMVELSKVSQKNHLFQLSSLRYNDNALSIIISAPSFADVDDVKKQLIAHNLKVKQQSGKMDGDKVKAELRLEVA